MSSANDEMPPNRQGRPPHTRLWLLAGIGLLVALPVAAGLVALASFNPNAYAPALIAAVERTTGRQLTLGGPVELHLSFNPTLTVSHVTLSNPAGGFAGDFVTLDRAEAKIALLPLLTHHLDILRLVLERPRITLQALPSGASNWDFSAAPGHATGAHHFHGYQLALEAVEIRDGHVTFIPASGKIYGFSLPHVTGTAASLTAPLHLSGDAKIGTREARLSGVVGPIARLSGTGTGPWPVDLSLTGAEATAHLAGIIGHPRNGQGYDLTLSVDVADLSALGALPALRQLHLGAEISDRDAPAPAIDNFSLTAGTSDLSALRPGLKLQDLDVEMASLDQPMTLQATGQLGTDLFSIKGAIGAPDALLAPARPSMGAAMPASLPVGLSLQLGDAKAAITGAIATPATLSGAALAINATIPDLSALSAAVGTALPAWKNITVQTTLTDPGGQGLRNAVGLDSLAVNADHAQFGGDASLFFGAHPNLQLALKFSTLDLDALSPALPPPAPAAAAQPATATPAPSWALPLAWLHLGDADIQLAADSLVWHKLSFTALQGHATLTSGVLALTPFTGELPGGEVSASASLDASKAPAAETLQLAAPALALSPLLHAFGLPGTAQGTAQLQLKAASTGDDVQTIAAGLSGSLGFAAVNGIVDGGVLNALLGGVLKTANLADPQLTAPGPVPVRCAALRLDATNGTGTLNALALDTPNLTLRGNGTMDFGKQTLALTLQPQPRGHAATPQVTLGGSFAQPTLTPAPAAAAAPGGDLCPAALNLARLGQSGPAAPPPGSFAVPAPNAAPRPGSPANLNSLLGQ